MFHVYADGVSVYDPLDSSYYLISPKLTLEWGKAGALEFVVPSTNFYYQKFQQLKTVVTVELDGSEIFRGRVLSIERDFNNLKTVYCEGDLSYLVDSVQKAEQYEGTTHDLFRRIIQKHNQRVEAYKQFTVGEITIENRSIVLTGQSEESGEFDYKQIAIDSIVDDWNNSYDYIQSCLIDYCGGYLRTRRVGNTTYIDLLETSGNTATQEIAFGQNLLDLTEEINAEELFTVLVPLGDENLTIASVNSGSDEISDSAAVERYGRIVQTHVFQNVTSAETLLENARRYLASHVNIPSVITVNAIDLRLAGNEYVSSINVGDRVHINSAAHGLVEYLTCTQIEYDFAAPENNKYTFGNPKQTLTERYREDKRVQNDTYGSEGIGNYASSGIGASGSAISKNADAKTKQLENKIAEEWLDIDPNNPDGVGSLGGLYRLFDKNRKVLENQVGIDFNAQQGNINLYSLSERVNTNTNKIETTRSEFKASTDVIDGKLTAVSSMTASFKSETDEKIGSLQVTANELGSAILAKADQIEFEAEKQRFRGLTEQIDEYKRSLKTQVGIDLDSATGNINIQSLSSKVDQNERLIAKNAASITTSANELGSRITLVAEGQTRTDTRVAAIELVNNRLQTSINLKADKVTVDSDLMAIRGRITAAEGEITELKARKITASEIAARIGEIDILTVRGLVANSIYASNTIQIGTGANNYVTTAGVVNSMLGKIGKNGSAGTAHYHLITVGDDGTISLGYATDKPQSFKISATKAYRDGVAAAAAAVTITELDRDEHFEDTYNSTTHATTVHLQALASNGKTKGANITVSGARAYRDGYEDGAEAGSAEAYTRGVESVDITSVARRVVPGYGTERYNVVDHTTTVFGIATASNGKTKEFDFTTGTQAYQAGVNTGQSNIQIGSLVREKSDYFNPTTHKTTVYVLGTATNNSTKTASFTTDTTAYDTGYNNVTLSLAKSDIVCSNDIAANTFTVTATAKASNGKTASNNQTFSAAPFNPTSIGLSLSPASDDPNSGDYQLYNISATAYNSSGKALYSTVQKSGNATIYNRGYAAGKAAVGIESIYRRQDDYYNTVSHDTVVYIQAKDSNGNTKNQDFWVQGDNAFNSVTISSIVRSRDDAYDSRTYNTTVYAKATASNGKERIETFTVSGSKAYDAGKADGGGNVTITSIARSRDDAYDSRTHNTTVYAKATASNGKERIETFTVSGSKAYEAGKSEAGDVTITSIARSRDDAYDSRTHNTTLYAKATASNGKERIETFTVSGSNAYNAGYNAGEGSVNVNWSDGSYDVWVSGKQMTGSKITSVMVTIILTNGKGVTTGWLSTDI